MISTLATRPMKWCVQAEVAKQLEALEAQLPVNDILLYRLLAEHKMQQREIHTATATDAEPAQASSENARSVNWPLYKPLMTRCFSNIQCRYFSQ